MRTTRPLNEGLNYGDVKQRLRKCRECRKNFDTFEVQESFFRRLAAAPPTTLQRQPLQMESKPPLPVESKPPLKIKSKVKAKRRKKNN
jgi:hypothetical protein